MYERILVPVDGGDTAKRGLDEALKIAAKLGSTVRVIHVVDDASLTKFADMITTKIGELLKLRASEGEQILAEAKRAAQSQGSSVETVMRHCTAGRVCDVIIEEASTWPCDLIVIGTHGHRGARRLLLGSDAEQVLRRASVPVLLVRGSGTATWRERMP
jgi:nucleotide-binding universal stress UspA family protein